MLCSSQANSPCMWATGPIRATSTPTTTSLKSTANHAITNTQARREKATRCSDYKGEEPIWSHGLQKDHLSQKEKEEIVRTHEISFLSLHSLTHRKRIRFQSRFQRKSDRR